MANKQVALLTSLACRLIYHWRVRKMIKQKWGWGIVGTGASQSRTASDVVLPGLSAGRVDGYRSGRTASRLLQTPSAVQDVRTRGSDPGSGHGAGQDLLQEPRPGRPGDRGPRQRGSVRTGGLSAECRAWEIRRAYPLFEPSTNAVSRSAQC